MHKSIIMSARIVISFRASTGERGGGRSKLILTRLSLHGEKWRDGDAQRSGNDEGESQLTC
jgi:hypothetical protein